MEIILHIFFYALTAVGVLTTVVVFFNDIHFDEKKFVWYHYIPCAVINVILGTLSPLVWSAFWVSLVGGAEVWIVLLMIGWAAAILANNLIFFIIFFRKDDFGRMFYMCLSLTSLFVISYWLIRIFY